MLVVSAMEFIPLFQASFIAAGLMVATGCVNLNIARRSIEYPVLAGIGASFALGFALAESGAAALLAGYIGDLARGDPFWALVVLYVATVILTELITNNAAGVLMFPIAMAVAHDGNVRLHAVRGRGDGGGFGRVHYAHRLSDQPDGLRSRRLPLVRLHTLRGAAQHPRRVSARY